MLLSRVDRAMAGKGYDYYRYVDDIRVIADTEIHARRALQDIIRLLRTVGLNINANKTAILSPETSQKDLAEFFPSQDSTTTAINQMWQSRSRRIVMRSVTYIFEILSKCIEAGETQTRSFRFARSEERGVGKEGVKTCR